MKTVTSRGGALEFKVPDDWRAEPDPDGNGNIFFPPDDPDTTLRLDVLTFKPPSRLTRPRAIDALKANFDSDAPPRELPNGSALATSLEEVEETGVRFMMRYWYLAHVRSRREVYVAIFSLALPPGGSGRTASQHPLVALFDSEVVSARFAWQK